MNPKPSPRGTQKKNKGGRPRVHGSKPGATATTWKRVSQPVSTHTYEVNSAGQIRRLKKDGSYYNIKPFVSGGPYASVYIYGVAGATRNRKKMYVHRLVAQAFVGGKRSGNVVHHKVSPASNTASTLEWVTPSQNLKARKFFKDDGTRKKKIPKVKRVSPVKSTPSPVVTPNVKLPVPTVKKTGLTAPTKVKTANIPVQPSPKKIIPKPGKVLPKAGGSDWPFEKKVAYLIKKWPPFRKEWASFRKAMPMVTRKTFLNSFRAATGGKGLEKKLDGGPKNWETRIRSAMYTIRQRFKV